MAASTIANQPDTRFSSPHRLHGGAHRSAAAELARPGLIDGVQSVEPIARSPDAWPMHRYRDPRTRRRCPDRRPSSDYFTLANLVSAVARSSPAQAAGAPSIASSCGHRPSTAVHREIEGTSHVADKGSAGGRVAQYPSHRGVAAGHDSVAGPHYLLRRTAIAVTDSNTYGSSASRISVRLQLCAKATDLFPARQKSDWLRGASAWRRCFGTFNGVSVRNSVHQSRQQKRRGQRAILDSISVRRPLQ